MYYECKEYMSRVSVIGERRSVRRLSGWRIWWRIWWSCVRIRRCLRWRSLWIWWSLRRLSFIVLFSIKRRKCSVIRWRCWCLSVLFLSNKYIFWIRFGVRRRRRWLIIRSGWKRVCGCGLSWRLSGRGLR